jgi:hypothetical protein
LNASGVTLNRSDTALDVSDVMCFLLPTSLADTFEINDPWQSRLSDGIYRYELRLLPRAAGQPEKTVQSGAVWVRDGAFVTPTSDTSKPTPIHNITGKDSVVPDDLVVQGTACIGSSCVNGDPTAANTLLLKARLPRIFFDDILSGAFPARDWILQANTADPLDYFILQDSSQPFRIQAGAPSNSIYVDNAGKLGLGTAAPAARLEVSSGEVRPPPGAGRRRFHALP